jgi:hypothetical protein
MALTPYMNLDLPVPTVTLGPEWAEQLNAALEFIDAHDHTTGKGNMIVTSAININADLSFNSYNLISARSYRMQNNGSPLAGANDLRAIYSVGGELYYNDGLGNQIQLTAGGALNASTIGGIGGDYSSSTANVYYTSLSKTFFFDQDTNKRAKVDIGDLIIRETVVGANGITVKSPTSLAAGYTVTLPTGVPASNLPVSMNASGDLSTGQIIEAQIATDAVTNTKIAADSITTVKVADDQINLAKLADEASPHEWFAEVFTSSGTWNAPSYVGTAFFEASGGGGGGGGGAAGQGGEGGDGGQYSIVPIEVTGGAAYTITLGGGGAGGGAGSNGTTGGDTTITGTGVNLGWKGGKGGLVGGSGTAFYDKTHDSGAAYGGKPGKAGAATARDAGGAGGGVNEGGGGGAAFGAGGNGGSGAGAGGGASANTGAGGGGGGATGNGATGGSGKVIVRYLKRLKP